MKNVKKEYLWALGAVAAILLIMLYAGAANAGCYKCTINKHYHTTVIEENTFIDIEEGVSDSELNAHFAGAIAASQINCNTSTRKNQGGIGLGYKGGANAGAVGYCKKVGDSPNYSQTFGGTVIVMSGEKPGYGLGWNIAW
jgi:hypothetical protein